MDRSSSFCRPQVPRAFPPATTLSLTRSRGNPAGVGHPRPPRRWPGSASPSSPYRVGALIWWRLDSRYGDLAACLPEMLSELHRARQLRSAGEATEGLLARHTARLMRSQTKFGLYDLS